MKKLKLTIEEVQNSQIEIIKKTAQKEVKGGSGIIVTVDIVL